MRGIRSARGWRDQRGFTLIELIVVIAIIGILATMALVNFRPSTTRSAVDLTARQIASTVNLTRQKASSQTLVDFNATGARTVPDRLDISFTKTGSAPWVMRVVACDLAGSVCAATVPLDAGQTFSSDTALLTTTGVPITNPTTISLLPPQGVLAGGATTIRIQSIDNPAFSKDVVISAFGQAVLQ